MEEKTYMEPKTIGLTEETKAKLDRLKLDGYFKEMQDAYKFAVGLALISGAISPPLKNTGTVYGAGDLDQDRSLYETVKALRTAYNDVDESIYKTIERLAEWGIKEMAAQIETGSLDLSTLMEKVRNM